MRISWESLFQRQLSNELITTRAFVTERLHVFVERLSELRISSLREKNQKTNSV